MSTMQNSIWAPINVVTFNTVVFMLTMAHLKAVLSDPGKVPLPQSRLDFSDLHSLQTSKKTDMEREEWTVSYTLSLFQGTLRFRKLSMKISYLTGLYQMWNIPATESSSLSYL